MTHTFDSIYNHNSSSYDSSSYDSSQTDFSSSQTSHALNTDLSHDSQAHATSGLGVAETIAFDITHCFDSGTSHSNHEQSVFQSNDGHLTSEYSGASIDYASLHSEVMNAPGGNSHSHLLHMECSDFSPYTTIDNYGNVYKHYGSASSEYDQVGYIKDRSFYNSSNCYLGYVGRDGKVYDDNDHLLGWQCGGTIYDKNGDAVPGAPHTSKGAIGAGAYLFFVQYGGV